MSTPVSQPPVGRGSLSRQVLNRVPADVRQKQIEDAKLESERLAARQRQMAAANPQPLPVLDDPPTPEPDWDTMEGEHGAKPAVAPPASATPRPALAASARHKAAELMRARLKAQPQSTQKIAQVGAKSPAIVLEKCATTPEPVPEGRNELLPPVDQDPIFRVLAAVGHMRPLARIQVLEASTKGLEFDIICRDPQSGRRYIIDKGRVMEMTPQGLVPFDVVPEFLKGYHVGDIVQSKTEVVDGKMETHRSVHRQLKLDLQF